MKIISYILIYYFIFTICTLPNIVNAKNNCNTSYTLSSFKRKYPEFNNMNNNSIARIAHHKLCRSLEFPDFLVQFCEGDWNCLGLEHDNPFHKSNSEAENDYSLNGSNINSEELQINKNNVIKVNAELLNKIIGKAITAFLFGIIIFIFVCLYKYIYVVKIKKHEFTSKGFGILSFIILNSFLLSVLGVMYTALIMSGILFIWFFAIRDEFKKKDETNSNISYNTSNNSNHFNDTKAIKNNTYEKNISKSVDINKNNNKYDNNQFPYQSNADNITEQNFEVVTIESIQSKLEELRIASPETACIATRDSEEGNMVRQRLRDYGVDAAIDKAENIAITGAEFLKLKKMGRDAADLAREDNEDGKSVRSRLLMYGAEAAFDRAQNILLKRVASQ